MKKLIILTLLLLAVTTLSATIVTQTGGTTFYINQSIGFDTTCHNGNWNLCDWYWGDGQVLLDVPNSADWRYHTYTQPGTYTVHFHREWVYVGGNMYPDSCNIIDEYLTITILDNRSITATPTNPLIGQPVTFTAVNFNTPTQILWHFGDGSTALGGPTVSHAYTKATTYLVQAFDWAGDTDTPISVSVSVGELPRQIVFTPANPRVDQPVYFSAQNFKSTTIDWKFGDGTGVHPGGTTIAYRFQADRAFTIRATESGTAESGAAVITITILPENRSVIASASQVLLNEPVTFTAMNFRSRALWDFGDGTPPAVGPRNISHAFSKPGIYHVSARDERGGSAKPFTADVRVIGITDTLNLLLAELSLENGKAYQVVPRNSGDIRGVLRMKLLGTGTVSGYWTVDGQPFEHFSQTAYQGEIKTIFTSRIPGLPTHTPGLHTLSVRLIRPAENAVFLPDLRYFVLPHENTIECIGPVDRSVSREDAIPLFSWRPARGASRYQIAFANGLLSMLENSPPLKWIDTLDKTEMTPATETWQGLSRNRWVYWRVRAQDSLGNTLAESPLMEMKIIVPEATISLLRLTDLEGNGLETRNGHPVARKSAALLHGRIQYAADAEYLIVRVFRNQVLSDQLLFRDMRRGEARDFETSVETEAGVNEIEFQVVKSSSPSIIIGSEKLLLEGGN